MKLDVILCSTRPQRLGVPIAAWALERARAHGKFDEITFVDLKAWSLPLLDEPQHPRLRQYQHEHTRKWSAEVDSADAFVFVMPEYNYSVVAPLVNALDYLVHEWAYKPVGLVSYGGISGGLRASQHAKTLITALNMMPIAEQVAITSASKHAQPEGAGLTDSAPFDKSIVTMLDALHRWAVALRTMRPAAT
jgi:NAD(P)H-dependent FMN reductase